MKNKRRNVKDFMYHEELSVDFVYLIYNNLSFNYI